MPDVHISRLPVNSLTELSSAINKILQYEQSNLQDWQKRILFIADNIPDPAGDFITLSESIISSQIPPGFLVDRVYENDYGCPPAPIRDIVINLHHRGDVIERDLGDGAALGARIRYSYEETILGTGGGLKHALQLLDPDRRDEPVVSMNGKLIFDVDLGALLAAHAADPGVLGTMVVQRVPDAVAWGAVDVVADGAGRPRVRNILGEGGFMFCGVHVTRPSVVARLPDGEACMVRQGYLPWLRAGGAVAAWEHRAGYFAEHSTPARYLHLKISVQK